MDKKDIFKIEDFAKFVKEYSFKTDDRFFSMNSLIGELGELANVMKKIEFFNHFEEYKKQVELDIENGKRIDYNTQLLNEFGDTIFYLFQLMISLNIDIESACKTQIEKIERQSKELNRKFIK